MIDYKWMAYGAGTEELILKYYIRGAVVLLNDNEQRTLYSYVQKSEKWAYLLQYLTNDKYVSVNNPIFRPRKYHVANFSKLGPVHKIKYQHIKESGLNPVTDRQLDVRSSTGHIKPIRFWQILKALSE